MPLHHYLYKKMPYKNIVYFQYHFHLLNKLVYLDSVSDKKLNFIFQYFIFFIYMHISHILCICSFRRICKNMIVLNSISDKSEFLGNNNMFIIHGTKSRPDFVLRDFVYRILFSY